jgi:hypothetical protein
VRPRALLIGAPDIENAREASPVRRREAAEHQLDRLHRRIDERPEQTAEVERIVDGNPVEQDEILVRFTAADVVAGGKVAAGEHPRKELNRAQEVGFPHRRHTVRDAAAQRDHAGAGPCVEPFAGVAGRDGAHRIERHGERHEPDEEVSGPPGLDDRLAVRQRVAESPHAEGDRAGREPGDGEAAGVIGDGRSRRAPDGDLRPRDRITRRRRDDRTGDGPGRLPSLRRGAGERRGEDRRPRREQTALTHAPSPARATHLLPQWAD